MNAFRLFIEENKALFQKKRVFASVLAVILVPLVFVAILLSPEWGPYDNLDNLPVAVVNNDAGAESNGEPLNVGNDLVANLKSNPTLGWDFVTSEEADKGLENMEYFMVIEVPENFSENVTTVLDESPKKAELKFVRNEGLHFMAAQVTDNAIATIRSQLSTQVTETYVRNVFAQLGGVTDGFEDAAAGSEQIHDGSDQLKDGTTEILDSLNEKAPDIGRLASGANELEAGTGEMLNSLTSKQGDITRLAQGAQELNSGTSELLNNLRNKASDVSELATGAKQVNDGTGLLLDTLQEKSGDIQKLAEGAKELEKGSEDLKNGAKKVSNGLDSSKAGSDELLTGLMERLAPGSKRVAAGVAETEAGVQETIESMTLLYNVLKGLPERHSSLEDDIVFNAALKKLGETLEGSDKKLKDLARLKDGANEIKEGLAPESNFYKGLTNLDNGLGELVAGQSELYAGATDLNEGAKQISAGNQDVYQGWTELEENVAVLHDGTTQIKNGNASVETGWGDLKVGAEQLHAGASQINDGNQTVNQGWQELSAGASQLNDGAEQVSDGNESVETGWTDLTNGVTQVDDGLSELQSGSSELTSGLQDGVESTSQLNPNDANMSMFASPVELDGEVVNGYQFYRDSSVPYIMSLALFAGVLAMSFIVQFRKPAIMPESGHSWFLGKAMNLSVLAILQAVIISLFALFVLKVQVESSILFILFAIGVSLTFLMIVMSLVAIAGNIGRFIALAIIVLQLSITGSDLPIEMLPEGFRTLSTYLPLTYSIDGFTSIVSLGNFSNVLPNAVALSIFFVTFAILAFVVFLVKFKRNKMDGETLPIKEEAS